MTVIVEVVAEPVTVTRYWVMCSVCGRLDHYPTEREAEQWRAHHRRGFHA
jgi:hypothetical protein